MDEVNAVGPAPDKKAVARPPRDIVAGGIMTAALVLFVGTGGAAMSRAIQAAQGAMSGVDGVMASALLLNIALIIFGWRRYEDMRQEMADRIAAEQSARELALCDPLTGLSNRRALGDTAAALAARAEQRGRSLAFLMIDLDHFKRINDLYGHVAGDMVLQAVSERISATLPAGVCVARLGGDEFACVMMFDPDEPGWIDRLADDLLAEIAKPVLHEGTHLSVTPSIGLSRLDQAQGDLDRLSQQAHIAMYAAKKTGRRRHAWFAPAMEHELRARSAIEAEMRRGIPAGEFVPVFEQQIDLSTGRLIGFEMLARWNSPTLGPLDPDSFVPLAEDTGLIGDLSLSVMRQAFLIAREWSPELTLAVNIAPLQLLDPWLSQKLLKLLVETGFPPTRLEIEITETSLFDNLTLARSIITGLKAQGIGIVLDDFGTGYSSLAHLRALPFDRIKIDRSFVISLPSNPESAAIVRAIMGLGDSLGLPITAEGVEDERIEALLRELGHFAVQGWFYGQPLTVAEVTEFARRREPGGTRPAPPPAAAAA